MLTLSHEAARLIRTLARKADASHGSGLRISVDSRHDSLSMALAAGAAPGDVVVLGGDSVVFLSPAASLRLSGRTLRAARPQERASFFLT
jgi:Fe-S cluster assembly iron-binding protein IscA